MKKLFIILVILVMAVSVNAASLKWDTSNNAVGYTVYFNGFTYNTNYNEVPDIDTTLNLHPGTTYTFTVRAYNQMGESGDSNAVDYTTADVYSPPEINIPVKKEIPPVVINFILNNIE